VSFVPPSYPYDRLDSLRDVAQQFEGGCIDCSVGTPIDPPPDSVLRVLAQGLGARGYPPSAGTPAYRLAARNWMERAFGVSLTDAQIGACVGTKEFVASLAGFLHLRTPQRDTVLYPSISYPTYAMGATLGSLRSVAVPQEDGRLRLDLISESDAERALVLWINSPSNPTGALDDLGAAAQWGRARGVLVASDECYSAFTWSGAPRSILQHGPAGVLAVHSISKRSNLAGIRAGFYAGDDEIVAYLRLVRQHAGLMVPGPVQAAVAAAYDDDDHVVIQRQRYLGRLELLSKALSATGIDAPVPDGAFYLWCQTGGSSGWELAAELAERTGMLVSPGEFYGDNDYVRIAVVQPDERLALAVERLLQG